MELSLYPQYIYPSRNVDKSVCKSLLIDPSEFLTYEKEELLGTAEINPLLIH
jgi:hypothetical protein